MIVSTADLIGIRFGQLLAEHDVFGAKGLSLDGAFDHAKDQRRFERLLNEVVRALPHGGDRVFDGRVRGHDDDVDLGSDRLGGLHEILARHSGHHEVGQDEIDMLGPDDFEREFTRHRRVHGGAVALEQALERLDVLGLVVHDQDRRAAKLLFVPRHNRRCSGTLASASKGQQPESQNQPGQVQRRRSVVVRE